MKSLADWAFDASMWLVDREGVKWEMLGWYHVAAKHHKVIEGLDADNSRLTELALTAAGIAESLDEHSKAIEVLDDLDQIHGKAETWFHYIVVGATGLGLGSFAGGLLSPADVLALPLLAIGGVLVGSGVAGVSLWHVWKHQIRTNVELMNRYNERLTERPGAVRRPDRASNLWFRCLLIKGLR